MLTLSHKLYDAIDLYIPNDRGYKGDLYRIATYLSNRGISLGELNMVYVAIDTIVSMAFEVGDISLDEYDLFCAIFKDIRSAITEMF